MSDLGFIDSVAAAALGVQPGPIRLLVGIAGPKGFGEAHLTSNPSRMKQFAGLSYPSAMAFVAEVARSWTKAAHGENGRLILISTRQSYDLRIIVEWKPGPNPFWNVITAIPSRVCREPIAYTKSAPPAAASAPQAAANDDSGEVERDTVEGSEPPRAPPKALPH